MVTSKLDRTPKDAKRYKDTLKASLKGFSINTRAWEHPAQEHTAW
jgi:hypothetical protein